MIIITTTTIIIIIIIIIIIATTAVMNYPILDKYYFAAHVCPFETQCKYS
jgi:hypothetical protein